MVAAHPFVITLVDLSFFVRAGKDLTKICFNNHWGIQVAGILIKTAADTYALVSFHHGLMFFAMRCLAWTCTSAGLFLSFCPRALSLSLSLSLSSLTLSLADTHLFILLFTLSRFCFLPLSGWQHTPNKMEFGAFEKPAAQPPNTSVLSGDWALVIEWAPISPNWQAVENNNDFHWKTNQTDDLKRNRLHTGKASGKMWMSTLPKHL